MRRWTGIRSLPAIVLVTIAGALAGCRAPGRALGPVEPVFAPAFEALGQAVEAGDDQVADQILTGILARQPEGDTLARAEAYDRILEGRRLARGLDLALVARPSNRDADHVAIALEARHDLDRTLRVRSLPAIMKLLLTGVDATGFEQRSARSIGIDQVAEFEVPAGSVKRIRLGQYPIATGTALAVRARFELEFPAGELELDGRPFPANELVVRPCSTVRLAEYLPAGAVEPSELIRYLSGERVSTPAMLERAVRIAPERRAEALDLLSASAQEMTRWELERALPALRWLSGNRHLGADVESWLIWLRARDEGEREANEDTELDLPAGARPSGSTAQ